MEGVQGGDDVMTEEERMENVSAPLLPTTSRRLPHRGRPRCLFPVPWKMLSSSDELDIGEVPRWLLLHCDHRHFRDFKEHLVLIVCLLWKKKQEEGG